MDAGTIAAIIIASFTAGIGTTLIVLLVRGGFLLGGLFKQVEGLGVQLEALTAAVNELRTDMQELRTEVQQSNQTLAVLANHTHDTDGRTVFQVPAAGR